MEKQNNGSTQDLFDIWVDLYRDTMGRFVEMPGVGPYREKTERMMSGVSTFVNLYTAWLDSSVDLQKVSTEAMFQTYQKAFAGFKAEPGYGGGQYKDIYKLWVETYSDAFKEFLKSGHFGEDQGKLISHLIEFQEYNREMFEENILKPMNLPTKTDINEANEELFHLKKKVKELTLQIKELIGK